VSVEVGKKMKSHIQEKFEANFEKKDKEEQNIGKQMEIICSDGTKRYATVTEIEFHEALQKNIYVGVTKYGNKVRMTREEIERFF